MNIAPVFGLLLWGRVDQLAAVLIVLPMAVMLVVGVYEHFLSSAPGQCVKSSRFRMGTVVQGERSPPRGFGSFGLLDRSAGLVPTKAQANIISLVQRLGSYLLDAAGAR